MLARRSRRPPPQSASIPWRNARHLPPTARALSEVLHPGRRGESGAPGRVRGSAAPRRRPRCGCTRRPSARTATGPGASPRRQACRSGSSSGPSRRGRCGRGSRAIWPSVTPNTRADSDAGVRSAANRSRSLNACGVMATTAPAASWSVLERRTVRRPDPSSSRATSAHVSAAASERRSPASLMTLTIARSRAARHCLSARPLSAPRIAATASAVSPRTWRTASPAPASRGRRAGVGEPGGRRAGQETSRVTASRGRRAGQETRRSRGSRRVEEGRGRSRKVEDERGRESRWGGGRGREGEPGREGDEDESQNQGGKAEKKVNARDL